MSVRKALKKQINLLGINLLDSLFCFVSSMRPLLLMLLAEVVAIKGKQNSKRLETLER